MQTNHTYSRLTRRGAVHKQVQEIRLREDLYCGAPFCKVCDVSGARLSDSLTKILILDTNVVLNQIDFLEDAAIEDVVILSVVFEEVKNKNVRIHDRLRAITNNSSRRFFVFSNENHKCTHVKKMSGETINDRNDRAIRVATKWYQNHLGDSVNVVLLTNDRENKRKATEEGISAHTFESYVKSLGQPELLDLIRVQAPKPEDINVSDVLEDHRPEKRRNIYPKHKNKCEIGRTYRQGKFRVNRHNPLEAYVTDEKSGDEIIIYGRLNMNRAFDGDIVAVQLLPKDQWRGEASMAITDEEDVEEDAKVLQNSMQGYSKSLRPCGQVVCIMNRNRHSYCGSLEPMEVAGRTARALFVPKDRRIPKIRVQTSQLENLVDKRIVVTVDSWDESSGYPSGHYVRTIGVIGDKDTETEVVLLENDVEFKPFSAQVFSCLPPLPWSVSPEDVADPVRQDLRHLRVFSVDPPGCTDIDDALHCTALPSGNFEVGVHIADVTNFVHSGTPLDLEASRRGTSAYLVDRRIDMLPKPLTEDICSLRADVERLAFSVIWEVTPQADIVATRFTKSVIKSCASLSYVEAQERMDNLRLMDPVTTDLRNMNALAKVMRQKRIDRGALTLASAEVKFEMDTETHNPLDIGMYQIRESNQMVEEFMLAANISVSEKILHRFPHCSLLRRHPTPTKEMLEPLITMASSVGLNLDVTSSKALADSLDRAVGDANDPYFNTLIRILATRCMSQAVYFSSGNLNTSEYHHYGLAAPLYTHFTSPIRRYADVIVHRLLAASLGISKLPNDFPDVSENLNYRHRNAQMASRASIELHTLMYFKNRPTDAEARILKIRSNGFIVFVPKYGIEGPVCLSKEGGWVVDEKEQRIRKNDGSIHYGVLQTVQIHMEVVEPQPHRPKLQLTLI